MTQTAGFISPLVGGLGVSHGSHQVNSSRKPNITGRRVWVSMHGTRTDAETPKATSSAPSVPSVGAPMPPGRRPDWFHVPAPRTRDAESSFKEVQTQLRELKLHTVCEEAQCPNIGECWNGGTATIMVLGDTCTRGCRFCAVKTSSAPPAPDPNEPFNTAVAVSQWTDISYVVLTSVDRDDIPDGGADHFAQTVRHIKNLRPEMLVECLVSDFQGDESAVRTLATCGLNVYAHNIETVRRLQPFVRDRRANYDQSMRVLRYAKEANPSLYTKSSIMLGLGETNEEVLETMEDLRRNNVDVVTFGQYLRPTEHHLSVVEYVHPSKFDMWADQARKMGFKYVASGPMVRSSYKAGEHFMEHMLRTAQQSENLP